MGDFAQGNLVRVNPQEHREDVHIYHKEVEVVDNLQWDDRIYQQRVGKEDRVLGDYFALMFFVLKIKIKSSIRQFFLYMVYR
jgi:hypothetical protein